MVVARRPALQGIVAMARWGAMIPPWWLRTRSASSRSGSALPGTEHPQGGSRSGVGWVVVPVAAEDDPEPGGDPLPPGQRGFLTSELLQGCRRAGELVALGAGASPQGDQGG